MPRSKNATFGTHFETVNIVSGNIYATAFWFLATFFLTTDTCFGIPGKIFEIHLLLNVKYK